MALRRVNISPLGVARRARPKPPGAWRVIPLLAGLAELGFWTVRGHPASIPGQIQAFASSFLLILVGIFIAGPWLTMAAARAMARWTSRPATLLAARRIGDDPKAAFRAVSGLVLALFITTVAVVAITTQDAKEPTRFGTVAETNLLTEQIASQSPSGSAMTGAGPAAPAAALAARLDPVHGVQGVAVIRVDPALTIPGTFPNVQRQRIRQSGPGPGRRDLVRAARDHTRPRPLPRRGERGGNPGVLVRPGWVQVQHLRGHLACRERSGRAAGLPRRGRHRRGNQRQRRAIEQARTVLETSPTPCSTAVHPADSSRRTTPPTAATSSSRTW